MVFGQWFFKWPFHNNIIDYMKVAKTHLLTGPTVLIQMQLIECQLKTVLLGLIIMLINHLLE